MGVCTSCAKMAARAGGQGQWAVVHLAGQHGTKVLAQRTAIFSLYKR